MRAGRALLGWNAIELAKHSGVGVATVRRYELQKGNTTVLVAIQKVFEREGIEFTGDPLVTPGVTLHLNHPPHQTDD